MVVEQTVIFAMVLYYKACAKANILAVGDKGDLNISNQASIPSSVFFTPSSYTSTRGHNLKLLKPFSRCRSRQLFFSVRSINDWNSLPAYIVNATSLDTYWTNIGPTNYLFS